MLDDVLVENKQAIEMTQIYRDIISGTRELMTTIINNRLNNAMKFLAAITIVMAVPTVISGVYGMNVGTKWMPFANVPYGFEIVCGIILVISIVIALILKKRRCSSSRKSCSSSGKLINRKANVLKCWHIASKIIYMYKCIIVFR